MNLKDYIKETPDFPKPGILFRDISPLLKDPELFQQTLSYMISQMLISNVDAFVGIESRGFILASALAARCYKGFIPMRKAGKTPPPVLSVKYDLEYGSAELELPPGKGRVAIIDDVLATGGTMDAAILLCNKAGYDVMYAFALVNLRHEIWQK